MFSENEFHFNSSLFIFSDRLASFISISWTSSKYFIVFLSIYEIFSQPAQEFLSSTFSWMSLKNFQFLFLITLYFFFLSSFFLSYAFNSSPFIFFIDIILSFSSSMLRYYLYYKKLYENISDDANKSKQTFGGTNDPCENCRGLLMIIFFIIY